MKLKVLKCPNCNAPLDNAEELDVMFCKYCGYKIIMDELSDAQIASRVKVKEMQHQKEMQANKYDQEKLRWERKEKSKSKEWLRNSLPIILLLAISISCFVLSEIHFNSEEKTSIKQEEQLQQIVEEVMIDIKNEDFVSARIKAETIQYTENWSDEIEKKWDATRKQLLKEIDAAEKNKKKEDGDDGGWFDWFD